MLIANAETLQNMEMWSDTGATPGGRLRSGGREKDGSSLGLGPGGILPSSIDKGAADGPSSWSATVNVMARCCGPATSSTPIDPAVDFSACMSPVPNIGGLKTRRRP